MAVEDISTYTEVDPQGLLYKNTTKAWVGYGFRPFYDTSIIYKDKGANYFTCDFQITLEISYDARIFNASKLYLWMISDNINDGQTHKNNDYDFYYLSYDGSILTLGEFVSGVDNTDTYNHGFDISLWYITIRKVDNSLYCYVYSDADKTIEVTTLNVTLSASKSFRYIYALSSSNQSVYNQQMDGGYAQNIEIGIIAEGALQRNYFRVYMRENSTLISSTDYDTLANWTTFLANFVNIGYCAGQGIDMNIVPNTVVSDYGEEIVASYDADLVVQFLQNKVADLTAIDDMVTKDCDMLLVDDINHRFCYIHNKDFYIEKKMTSGQVSQTDILLNQKAVEWNGLFGFYYIITDIPTS